ncbi:MAG: T9SS type A sorting domain-containing protein [Williamsia sp.]|nr:T9SS type A sorting domain-containing protein [Williamsia sp.]
MRKLYCLLLQVCLLLATGRLSAQSCLVTISTNTGTSQLNCKNEKITLHATEGFITYAWKKTGNNATLSTTSTLEVSDSGTYIVQVTGINPDNPDGPLCTTSHSTIITADKNPPAIDIRARPATICYGDSTLLLATARGADTISWEPGSYQNPIYIAPQKTASYEVTVKGLNGCSATSSVTVVVNPLPGVSINYPDTVCKDASDQVIKFTGTSPEGMPKAPPYTFTYTVDNSLMQILKTDTLDKTQYSATVSIPTNKPGKVQYKLESVRDSNACSSQVQQIVNVVVSQEASLSGDKIFSICNNAGFYYEPKSQGNIVSYKWVRDAADSVTSKVPGATDHFFVNDILYNWSSRPQVVTYRVKLFDGRCDSYDSIKLTVMPSPAVDSIPDFVFCKSIQTPAIKFRSSSPGTTFEWTNNNTNIGLPVDGSGDTIQFSTKNDTKDSLKADIKILPLIKNSSNMSCSGTARTFRITVLPSALLTSTSDTSICSDQLFTYKASSYTNGISFKWARDSVEGITNRPGSGIGPDVRETLHNNGSVSREVIYKFTLSDSLGCATTITNVNVTVKPLPALVELNRNQAVCDSTPFRYEIKLPDNIETFKWVRNFVDGLGNPADSSSSTSINETFYNTVKELRETLYKLAFSDKSGCAAIDSVKLTVNPTLVIDSIGDSVYCRSTLMPGVIFTPTIPGALFNWISDTKAIGMRDSIGAGNIPPFVAKNDRKDAITANITVTSGIKNGSGVCKGTGRSFKITVLSAPYLTGRKDTSICSTPTFRYPVESSVSGTGFSWRREPATGIGFAKSTGDGAVIIDSLVNTGTQPIVVTYRFTLSVGKDCPGTDSIKVTVNPTPVIDKVSVPEYCSSASVPGINFSSATPDLLYTWKNSNTSIGLQDSTGSGLLLPFVAQNSTNANISSNVAVFATTKDAGCPSKDSMRFTITVKPSPPKPSFTSLSRYADGNPLSVCQGYENVDFHVNTPVTNLAYLWTYQRVDQLAQNGVTIKRPQDSATVINFDNAGSYIIKLTDSNTTTTCTNTATQVVAVGTGQKITSQRIQLFNSNLLIYPDRSLKGYQWGYDPIIRLSPGIDTIYGRSVPLPGQIYQYFVPPSNLIDQVNHVLDTAHNAFWVQLQNNESCYTRVYYGKYRGNRVITITPVSDTIKVQLIPNPNKGSFKLAVSGDISGKIEAQIHDAVGRLVFAKSFVKAAPSITEVFSAGNLPGGVYFLTLQSGELKTAVTRFVITN